MKSLARPPLGPTLLALLALALPARAQIPAFPGAEGFGAHATGGRGGDVYTVTNLNASGAGSLREGIETAPSSGRTIVFAVSGYIHVPGSNLRIVQDKVTIAGQTAPGDGIGLRDGTVRITGDNCVIRNLRIRHGRYGGGGDCLNVDSSAHDSIVDHVSMQFSTDENVSFFNSTLDNFTMQDSLSAWGLESHNAGGLWDLEDGSCIGSLWAHHHTRNPKARPYGLLEWVNNVTFDWGIGFIMGDSQTPAPWKANVVGSYFLSPPTYTDDYALEKATVDRNGNPNFTLWLDDCLHDSDGDGLLNGTDKGYAIVRGSEFTAGDPPGANRYVKAASPFTGATGNIAVTVDDPLTAYKKVLSQAGAVRLSANHAGPLRDEVDTLLFDNLANQIHSRISNENQLPVSNNGMGTLNSTTPPLDTDLDGMPDFYEGALGFSITTQNHNTVFGSTAGTFLPPGTPVGYTHLDEYLHYKSVPHGVVAKNTAAQPSSITVDLRKYTSGFDNSPVFGISGAYNGSYQQFAANGVTPSATGPIVTFTPTLNFAGRAGFDFTVDDGSLWTQQFALLTTVAALPRDLVWTGGNGGNAWDTATTNWETGAAPTTFNDGDNTLFDDQGNAATIPVSGARSPNSVTVTGTQDYHFAGPGSLSVATSFTKASDTTLTLDTTVSTGNGLYLNGGGTVVNHISGVTQNVTGGPIRFTGGATFTDNTGSDYHTLAPNLLVDSGAVGNVNFSDRCDFTGSLSGGGTFNLFSPSTLGVEGRVYFSGASAGCTGSVNLAGGGSGRIAFITNGGAFNGFDNARVHLDGVTIFTRNNSGGNTYGLGSLSGTADATIVGPYYAGTATWNIGGLGLDSEFAGVISNGTSGQLNHVNKYGGGTLTLSGNNSYTGTTAIYEGELRVTGSLGATNNYVGTGATLSGSGPVAALLTGQDGSTISPGDNPGEAGTMTTGNGIELKQTTMRFDLSGNPASGNDQILNSAGTLVFRDTGAGAAFFEFNLIDGYLSPGTYTLVSGGAGTSAPGSPSYTNSHNLPASTRQSFAIQRSGGGSTDAFVRLVVTGNSSDLTWTGSTSTWNVANTTPWSGGAGGDNKFYNLDRVHFTDSAGNQVVTLSGDLEPQSATVSAGSGNYFFNGSGRLTGDARLVKSGAGTLLLATSTALAHGGGTLVSDGLLALANTTSGLGTGLVELAGGTLQLPSSATFLDNSFLVTGDCAITSPYGGNSTIVDTFDDTFRSTGSPVVDLSGVAGILSIKGAMDGFGGTLDFGAGGGMLRLNSGTVAAQDVNFGSSAAHFALGTAGATLTNRNGDKTIELGALSGGPGTHLNGRQSGSGNTSTTYRIGALGLDTCFDGTIDNGGDLAGLDLVKVGSGRLCLGGTSDYPGSLFVEAGTLALPGALTITGSTEVDPGAVLELDGGTLTTESVQVFPGATLTGPGTIHGELTNDGMLSCTTGTLLLDGVVVNNGTARLTTGALLATTDTFYNNGILDLLTADGEVPANLVNNGIVIDSSGLEVDSIAIDGSDFVVSIHTYAGHDYQLQWSDTLLPGSWNDVGAPEAGDGTVKPFTDPGATTHGARHYRILVTP